jgi:N-acetylglucosaminyl-diphospho-decaprenol L-rhamnosyltransferase
MRPASPDPALAVVIVNFNSGDHLRECLSSLPAAFEGTEAEALAEIPVEIPVEVPMEIVVVDNCSTDDSVRRGTEAPVEARWIFNERNAGFAAAANRGVAATSAPYVFLLNPDGIARPGSLAGLVQAAAERPRAGAIGPRVVNSDGTLQASCRVIPDLKTAVGHAFLGLIVPSNRFTRRYHLQDWDHLSEREVDWVSGSTMLLKREAFEEVGGFDEGFFMYVEDLDLCDRLRDAGWKVIYYPEAEVMHHIGISTRRTPYRMIVHHHISAWRYAVKKARRSPRVLALPFVAAGLLARLAVAVVRQMLIAVRGRMRPEGANP